jgi:hypothetical protein
MASGSDFVTTYRQATTRWLTALEDLLALKSQYTALDLGSTLTEEDFAGANSDLDAADIAAGVTSVDAINALFITGHNTVLYTLKQ